MTVTLRPATDRDRDRIAAIWHAGASLPGVGPPLMPGRAELRRRVDEEMADGWQVVLAEIAGETVGFVALRPARQLLAELFLDPAHLHRGIGRLLLDHAKSAMPRGFSLFTTAANARARHFYEREGLVAGRMASHPRAGHPVVWYRWPGIR